MQRTENTQTMKSAKRRVKASTTLKREYVGHPSRQMGTMMEVKKSPKIQRFNVAVKDNNNAMATSSTSVKMTTVRQEMQPVQAHPLQEKVNIKMRSKQSVASTQQIKKETAKELKEKAITKALAMASAPDKTEDATKSFKKSKKMHFGFGRVVLALSCAAVVVFAVVYFVNLNMPDVSMKVAAMQTGINASYPDYVPRDYSISSITSEDKKITLKFKNSSLGKEFTLIEETSSWDSNALLNNYIKDEYGENYTTVREQGLTIYVSDSNAAWVNGGIVYKINAENNTLTNKQIKSIAVSL